MSRARSEILLFVRSAKGIGILPGTPSRNFSLSSISAAQRKYKLVVVGGGAGGCGTASKFVNKFAPGEVCVIDPASEHYYQPMWTLVGGGTKNLSQSVRPMKSVLPSKATWLQDSVQTFEPTKNQVVTSNGDVVSYEWLVVATGLQTRYDKIKGLPEAFDHPGVGSNYSAKYVEKTTKAIEEFKGGKAVFTFPMGAIKCPGAPQKIVYMAEENWRQKGIKADIEFRSSLGVLFGVKKYADALWEVVKGRGINVHLKQNLVEVRPETKEAVFENLDSGEQTVVNYDMLHVTPPMETPPCLSGSNNPDLVDAAGYLTVNKETLQHTKFPNIFGIGDCTNVPTSKTAAAVAAQLGIMRKNLGAAISGTNLPAKYDGYTSCPLVTGSSTCILAEFDFQAPPQPLETFPVNQAKERRTMYLMKAHVMPQLYWLALLKGNWEGPAIFRKLFRLGF